MKRNRKGIVLKDAVNCSTAKEYTQIPNELIRNPEISGKAKAILCLLLSNRDGWKSHVETILSMMKEGEEAITSGLRELEQQGYLIRMRYRDTETKAFKGILWAYTDTPNIFNIDNSKTLLQSLDYEIVVKKSHNLETHDVVKKSHNLETHDVGNPRCGKPGTNNTNIKKINIKKTLGKTAEASKNKTYLPIARKLSLIVKKIKNVKHTYFQLIAWSKHIRLLVEKNKVSMDRIEIALKWYSKHHSDKYVPIIESGESLRSKFIKLEDAIKRGSIDNKQETLTHLNRGDLHDEIKSRMNGVGNSVSTRMIITRMINLFDKICKDSQNDIASFYLVDNLSMLYSDVVKSRPEDAMNKTEHSEDIGTPIYLLEEYSDWLKDETWIKDINENVFTFKSKLFKKFLNHFGEEIGLNPLTGNYK